MPLWLALLILAVIAAVITSAALVLAGRGMDEIDDQLARQLADTDGNEAAGATFNQGEI